MTQQMIDVIQAHMRGEKIELRDRRSSPGCLSTWFTQPGDPLWNFANFEYRIAPEPKIPDSIDWSHVAPEFKFMARDEDGCGYLFTSNPCVDGDGWFSVNLDSSLADAFTSYKRGNMEWQDSLVERPKP